MNTTAEITRLIRARQALPSPAMRRAIRENAKLPRRAVARELHVTEQAVAFWEDGRRYPSDRYLEPYIEVLRAIQEASS